MINNKIKLISIASIAILAGCSSNQISNTTTTTGDIATGDTNISTGTQIISTGEIQQTGTITQTGNTTNTNTQSPEYEAMKKKIQELANKRQKAISGETKLTEEDIQLMEDILNEISKSK